MNLLDKLPRKKTITNKSIRVNIATVLWAFGLTLMVLAYKAGERTGEVLA